MKFNWSTIGHDAAKRVVESLAVLPRMPSHAFILSGPKHIGKSTFARDMVAILMCTDAQTRPCGSCIHCQHISRNSHPDIYGVSAGRPEDSKARSQSISVEDIRDRIDQLQTSALFQHRKVFLIEDAESLTVGASNALLKTLEEPRGNTLFIFVSNSEEALLPTIRSRCQLMRMYPLSIQTIYRELTSRLVPVETAKTLARYSKGRFGLVSHFIESLSEWDQTARQMEQDIQTLFGLGTDKHRWYENSDSIPFVSFVDFVHDALLASVGLPERAVASSGRGTAFVRSDAQRLVSLLETCMDAIRLRSQNVNPKLLLDLIHTRSRFVVQ